MARASLGVAGDPESDDVQRAWEVCQKGLFRHGIALLNRFLQRDFQAEMAWDFKGQFLDALGFRQSNERMLEEALARGGPSGLLISYGALLKRRGALPEALAAFQRYLATSPGDSRRAATAWSEVGMLQAALGDFQAAEQAHWQAVQVLPEYALLYLNYADTFIKQRRWDDALTVLDVGLGRAASPDETISLLEAKAHVLAGQMRGDEALACVDRARALGSDSVKTHYIRGRALAMIGRLDEARAAMERVLQLDPKMEHAHQAIKQIDDALRS
jgi:tetratricopeptide (TPR) repeat protein